MAGFLIAVTYAGQPQAQDLEGLFMDTPDDPVAPTLGNGWHLSVSAGAITHQAVRTSNSHRGESGVVFNLGLGHPVSSNKVMEWDASIYDPNPADFGLSVFQFKMLWRWYPGMNKPQRDQFYLQGGGTILGAHSRRGTTRVGYGGGFDFGLDWFHSETRSYFIQAGFSALIMHGDDPLPPGPEFPLQAATTTVVEPTPMGLMAQVVVGVRVGL
jgi:hypothetical protein